MVDYQTIGTFTETQPNGDPFPELEAGVADTTGEGNFGDAGDTIQFKVCGKVFSHYDLGKQFQYKFKGPLSANPTQAQFEKLAQYLITRFKLFEKASTVRCGPAPEVVVTLPGTLKQIEQSGLLEGLKFKSEEVTVPQPAKKVPAGKAFVVTFKKGSWAYTRFPQRFNKIPWAAGKQWAFYKKRGDNSYTITLKKGANAEGAFEYLRDKTDVFKGASASPRIINLTTSKKQPDKIETKLTFDQASESYSKFVEKFVAAPKAYLYDVDDNRANGNELYLSEIARNNLAAKFSATNEGDTPDVTSTISSQAEMDRLNAILAVWKAATWADIAEKVRRTGVEVYVLDKSGSPDTVNDAYFVNVAAHAQASSVLTAALPLFASPASSSPAPKATGPETAETPYGKLPLLHDPKANLNYYAYAPLLIKKDTNEFDRAQILGFVQFPYDSVRPGMFDISARTDESTPASSFDSSWRFPKDDEEAKRELEKFIKKPENRALFPEDVEPSLANLAKSKIRITRSQDGHFFPVIPVSQTKKCHGVNTALRVLEVAVPEDEVQDVAYLLGIPYSGDSDKILCMDEGLTIELVKKEGQGKVKLRIKYPQSLLTARIQELKDVIAKAKGGEVKFSDGVELKEKFAKGLLEALEKLENGDEKSFWGGLGETFSGFAGSPYTHLLLIIVGLSVGTYIFLRTPLGARIRTKGDLLYERYREKLSRTNFLEKYGTNLTERAKLPPTHPDSIRRVAGRDAPEDVRRSVAILGKKDINSVLYAGPAGTGKTLRAENVAVSLLHDPNVEILEMDIPGMLAGTKYRGMFEERFKGSINQVLEAARGTEGTKARKVARAILRLAGRRIARARVAAEKYAIQSGKRVILFIDELHTIMGAGKAEGVTMDAANMLKPMLAKGRVTVIGATTTDEMIHILRDPAMARRFEIIFVKPPDKHETLNILRQISGEYASHHGVEYPEEVLKFIVDVSSKSGFGLPVDMDIPPEIAKRIHKSQPASAIDLMDLVGADLKHRLETREASSNVITREMVEDLSGRAVIETLARQSRGRVEEARGELDWLKRSQTDRHEDLEWLYPDALEDNRRGYEGRLRMSRNADGVLMVTLEDGREIRADNYLVQLDEEAKELEGRIRALRGSETVEGNPLTGQRPGEITKDGRPRGRELLDQIEIAQRRLNLAVLGGGENARAVRPAEVADQVRPLVDAMDVNERMSRTAEKPEEELITRLEATLKGLEEQVALFDAPADSEKPGIRALQAKVRETQEQYRARGRAAEARTGEETGRTTWDVTPADRASYNEEAQNQNLRERSSGQEDLPKAMQVPAMRADETPEEYRDRLEKEVLPESKRHLEARVAVWNSAYEAEQKRLAEKAISEGRASPSIIAFRRVEADAVVPPSIAHEAKRNVDAWGEVLFQRLSDGVLERALTQVPRGVRENYRSLVREYEKRNGRRPQFVHELAEMLDPAVFEHLSQEMGRGDADHLRRGDRLVAEVLVRDAEAKGAWSEGKPGDRGKVAHRLERAMRDGAGKSVPKPHRRVPEVEPPREPAPKPKAFEVKPLTSSDLVRLFPRMDERFDRGRGSRGRAERVKASFLHGASHAERQIFERLFPGDMVPESALDIARAIEREFPERRAELIARFLLQGKHPLADSTSLASGLLASATVDARDAQDRESDVRRSQRAELRYRKLLDEKAKRGSRLTEEERARVKEWREARERAKAKQKRAKPAIPLPL